MTPKEKAEELVKEFLIHFVEFYNDKEYDYNIDKAKQCALILIQELIEANKKCSYTIDYTNTSHAIKLDAKVRSEIELFMIYWLEVKQEIELL